MEPTATPRPYPRMLTLDEASFLDAAFARLFPGTSVASRGSEHVDQRLQEERCSGVAPSEDFPGIGAAAYRNAIPVVQAYCLQTFDRRFQALSPREQDGVLLLLEESSASLKTPCQGLLNDATEALLTRTLFPSLGRSALLVPSLNATAPHAVAFPRELPTPSAQARAWPEHDVAARPHDPDWHGWAVDPLTHWRPDHARPSHSNAG